MMSNLLDPHRLWDKEWIKTLQGPRNQYDLRIIRADKVLGISTDRIRW